MLYLPWEVVHGNENIRPSGTPYVFPSVREAIDCQSSPPAIQSLIWSIEALPAEAAEDAPLSAMISAPLYCTLGVNSLTFQSASMRLLAGLPPIVQFLTSGYMVGEWFPQIAIFLISVTFVPVYRASWVTALLWSSLVIAVKFS